MTEDGIYSGSTGLCPARGRQARVWRGAPVPRPEGLLEVERRAGVSSRSRRSGSEGRCRPNPREPARRRPSPHPGRRPPVLSVVIDSVQGSASANSTRCSPPDTAPRPNRAAGAAQASSGRALAPWRRVPRALWVGARPGPPSLRGWGVGPRGVEGLEGARRALRGSGADGASARVSLHCVLDPLGPRGRPGAGRTVSRRPDLVGLAPPLPALNHHPRPNQVTPGRGQRAPTPNPRRRPSPAGVGPHRGTGTAGLRLPARRARQANRALRPAIWTRAPAPGPHATQAPAGFPAGPSVRDGGHFTPHQRRDRGRRLRRDSPDRPIPYLAPAAYTPPPWNVSIS